ncbi:MAG TPA: hypothetical protein VKP58_08300 [Candidatus Acidoferrum sp.]|nr:hypothetical protein [Candidatus Acidoferrum sp.]
MSVSVLAVFAIPAVSQEKSTSLADARSEVETNLRTKEGKTYDEQLGKEFQQKHLSTLRECKKSTGDLSNFWILMKVDKTGAVKEVLLSPTTKLGSCTRDVLLKSSFSPPPKQNHWVSIYLQLTK